MENEPLQPASPNLLWRPVQVIVLSAVCLIIGLAVGYFLRGSASVATAASTATTGTAAMPPAPRAEGATAASMPANTPEGHPQLTLDDMKRMADAKAAKLLEKLKDNPKDAATLNQLGILYRATHQFKEAEGYFEKSLEIDPKNADARVDLASCLYYTGDVDLSLIHI